MSRPQFPKEFREMLAGQLPQREERFLRSREPFRNAMECLTFCSLYPILLGNLGKLVGTHFRTARAKMNVIDSDPLNKRLAKWFWTRLNVRLGDDIIAEIRSSLNLDYHRKKIIQLVFLTGLSRDNSLSTPSVYHDLLEHITSPWLPSLATSPVGFPISAVSELLPCEFRKLMESSQHVVQFSPETSDSAPDVSAFISNPTTIHYEIRYHGRRAGRSLESTLPLNERFKFAGEKIELRFFDHELGWKWCRVELGTGMIVTMNMDGSVGGRSAYYLAMPHATPNGNGKDIDILEDFVLNLEEHPPRWFNRDFAGTVITETISKLRSVAKRRLDKASVAEVRSLTVTPEKQWLFYGVIRQCGLDGVQVYRLKEFQRVFPGFFQAFDIDDLRTIAMTAPPLKRLLRRWDAGVRSAGKREYGSDWQACKAVAMAEFAADGILVTDDDVEQLNCLSVGLGTSGLFSGRLSTWRKAYLVWAAQQISTERAHIGQLTDLWDFVSSTHYVVTCQTTIKSLRHRHDEWYRQLRQPGTRPGTLSPDLSFPSAWLPEHSQLADGHCIRHVATSQELWDLGEDQCHCIYSYAGKVLGGACQVYVLVDHKTNHVRATIMIGKNGASLELKHVRCKRNKLPDEMMLNQTKAWFAEALMPAPESEEEPSEVPVDKGSQLPT